ncbi:MAG: VanZ family protein [Pseudomonadota bacterium]
MILLHTRETLLQPGQARRIWLLAGWMGLAAIFVLSTVPTVETFDDLIGWNDKIRHALAYGVMMGWFAHAYPQKSWPYLAALLFTYSGALEVVQHTLPARQGSIDDLAANAVGIIVVYLAYRPMITDSDPSTE